MKSLTYDGVIVFARLRAVGRISAVCTGLVLLLLVTASSASAFSSSIGDFSAVAKAKPFSSGSSRALLVGSVTAKGPGLLQGRPQIKCGRKGCRRLRNKRYSRSKLYRQTVKFRNANIIVKRGKSFTIRLVSNDKSVAGRYLTLSLKTKGKLRLRQTAYGCIDGGGRVVACPSAPPAAPTRESHPPLFLFGDSACENSAPEPWEALPTGSAAVTALATPGIPKVGSGYCRIHTLGTTNSVARDVTGSVRAGQEFEYSTWLRSSDGQLFCGTLTLWGMGATNDNDGHKTFCVGAEWTLVSTRLKATKVYSKLRSQIYFGASANDLYFDGPSLTTGLVNSSFEAGSPSPWSDFANPGVALATFSAPGVATDGNSFLSAKATSPTHSFVQDVAANPKPGQSFTASIWLRSANGASINASFALHAWNGVAAPENSTKSIVVDGTWRKYVVTLVPTTAAHSLRFEVYLNTANAELFADDAQLFLN